MKSKKMKNTKKTQCLPFHNIFKQLEKSSTGNNEYYSEMTSKQVRGRAMFYIHQHVENKLKMIERRRDEE